MKKSILILAAITLSGCVTVAETPQTTPERETKSYPQDKEMCEAQPDVAWCQIACDVDDNSYSWCPRES